MVHIYFREFSSVKSSCYYYDVNLYSYSQARMVTHAMRQSKTASMDYLKRMKNNPKLRNKPLNCHPQWKCILNLIGRHPKLAGKHIMDIQIRNSPPGKFSTCKTSKDFCFFAETTTKESISCAIKYCVSPDSYKKASKLDITNSFRHNINHQALAYKQTQFRNMAGCVYSSVNPSIRLKMEDTHVDHHPMSFKDIMAGFLASPRGREHGDGVLTDNTTINRWQAFHKTHAKYRLLSTSEHIEATKTGLREQTRSSIASHMTNEMK
jgi:hypothetical protein